MHGGKAPQVREAALERLRRLQHPAIDRLVELMEQHEFPSTAYQAVRDVLDRTLGRPIETVDMTIAGDQELIARLKAGRARIAKGT